MQESSKKLFDDVLEELEKKIKQNPNDKTYEVIWTQIKFVYDCQKNKRDIKKELGGRELDFQVIASRNLGGSEEELLDKIGDVAVYVSNL